MPLRSSRCVRARVRWFSVTVAVVLCEGCAPLHMSMHARLHCTIRPLGTRPVGGGRHGGAASAFTRACAMDTLLVASVPHLR